MASLSSNGSGNVLWWCPVSCTVELLCECLRPDGVSAGGEGAAQGKLILYTVLSCSALFII